MGKIILLDEQTSCQIAAGEVVERPSSVVKELVENSIDAGSTRIKVEIVNGGIKLIRVTDNGCGMEPDDCLIAFDKHATSKIISSDDLFNITTMGFRGEALASIAAVSKVTLCTKTAHDPEGTCVVIEGGELRETGTVGVPSGTKITVENLFYNTPARYKFLKRDRTEALYVAEILEKIALANPGISFTLISDKKQIMYTPGGGDLKKVVLGIYGRDVAEKLIDISSVTGTVSVNGLCGDKDLTFGNRSRQIFFVNGRNVKSKIISSAVDEAYKTLTMKGRFPFVILGISLPASSVDVNVHPAKTEVRFADENLIFKAVYHAVFDTLRGVGDPLSDNVISYDTKRPEGHSSENGAGSGSLNANANADNDAEFLKGLKDVTETEQGSLFDIARNYGGVTSDRSLKNDKDQSSSFVKAELPQSGPAKDPSESFVNDQSDDSDLFVQGSSYTREVFSSENSSPEERQPALPDRPTPKSSIIDTGNIVVYENGRVVGQLFDTYIILEYGTRMYLLDQHAAHERLKYEEIKQALQNTTNPSQLLLIPVTIRLSPKEFSAFSGCRSFFEQLGFEIEEFSGNALIVRSVPTLIERETAADFIITALNNGRPGDAHINVFTDNAIYTMACKAAIKANRKLSAPEIEALLKELIRVDNPGTCPHGRPILISFTQYEIERRFHRA